MALEDVHLDVLQNIEFAIVSVYRKQHALRDVEVMRALDALIDVYRAKARGHTPKSLSENLRCAEGNKSTCQFEHRQVVLDLLFPPDQQAPKAVHPRMRPFHDPAAGTVARNLSFGGGFFAARPHMGDIV